MPTLGYEFHTDPGHGWLAVPVAELRELGIAGRITGYSYLSDDGRMAYLEEDCDATEFVNAMQRVRGVSLHELRNMTEEVFHEHDAPMRGMRRYPTGGPA